MPVREETGFPFFSPTVWDEAEGISDTHLQAGIVCGSISHCQQCHECRKRVCMLNVMKKVPVSAASHLMFSSTLSHSGVRFPRGIKNEPQRHQEKSPLTSSCLGDFVV